MSEYKLYETSDPDLSEVEKSIYNEISADEPWDLVEKFSTLERVSGTQDEQQAAEYLINRLDELNIPFERYNPELYLSQPKTAELSVVGSDDQIFSSTKTVAFSNSETVQGEAIYIDQGDEEESSGALDLDLSIENINQDIEGKIIVMESLLPIRAISEFADAGAAAFIAIHPHPDEPHEGIATPIWGGVPNPQDDENIPDIAIVTLSRTEGTELIELLDNQDRIDLEVSTELETDWFECPIVTSRIPGDQKPDNDDFVLLHGHLDSWHVGVTDNATGDACLLECARVFNQHRNQLRRDLWIAWWPGHSTGRYAGSTWFVDEFAHEFNDHCVAHVNIDHPGVKDATEFLGRVQWMPEADQLCKGVVTDVAGKETEENRPSRAGDYTLNNIGIPGISLQSCIPAEIRDERGYHPVGGSGGHANAWHLSTDTIDKADPEVLVRDTRVNAIATARLLNLEILPLDHRHTVERHLNIIEQYQKTAGDHFDLSPVQESLELLNDDIEKFYDKIDSNSIDVSVANTTIKKLSRILTRVNFATESPFEQDPALFRPPYPMLAPVNDLESLEGDVYQFQKVHLKRARNDVLSRLRTAKTTVPVEND